MDSQSKPSKEIIENVFNRLKQQTCNKMCFDCGSKNPTWSSVTFGVFICIDCSAVHRNLGVHLTFVRSINLDTNWTWLQLWQMELGGNANASQFFRQHSCTSTDAQEKYNSRAAQLYKDKLLGKTSNAIKKYGAKIDLQPSFDKLKSNLEIEQSCSIKTNIYDENLDEKELHTDNQFIDASTSSTVYKKLEPSVDFLNSTVAMDISKSSIGNRKPLQKKTNFGMKKRSLGATKVTTDFADIEKKANNVDVNLGGKNKKKIQTDEYADSSNFTMAFQNLTFHNDKKEERIKTIDPEKAKQLDRLGMGVSFKSEVTHSALTDMDTLDVESTKLPKFLDRETLNVDVFDEDAAIMYNSTKSENTHFTNIRNDSIEPQITTMFTPISNLNFKEQPIRSKTVQKSYEDDTAQKKFGGAKCISSKQFFEGDLSTVDNAYNLTRFEGSSSISSADYFQTDTKQRIGHKSYGLNVNHHDMDDVKESVRQGVTKVAGRLSSLANDVMSSLQEKYGY